MKRRRIRLLAPMAVILSIALALPVFSSAANGVDLSKKCSLKINLTSNDEMREDLSDVRVQIDVYKVADADQMTANGITYDAYKFKAKPAYSSLDLTLSEDRDWKEWQAEAQKAAAIVRADTAGSNAELFQSMVVDMSDAANPVNIISSLNSGLYLLIVHGEGLSADEYFKTLEENVTDEDLGIEKTAGSLVTVAYSDVYEYSFLPELVALPNKYTASGQAPLPPGQLGNSAADNGAWVYDYEVYLKPGREHRFGSLEIVKDLRSYATWDYTVEEATFVFQIEAVRDGKVVYSDVESLTFTRAEEKRILIENKIPAGATVTVTEVYSGSSYTVEGAAEQTVQIGANELTSVSFRNVFDDRQTGGHGIINHFALQEDAGGWIHGWSSAEDSLGIPNRTSGQAGTGTNPAAGQTGTDQTAGQTGTGTDPAAGQTGTDQTAGQTGTGTDQAGTESTPAGSQTGTETNPPESQTEEGTNPAE